jgi:hypothetical protein
MDISVIERPLADALRSWLCYVYPKVREQNDITKLRRNGWKIAINFTHLLEIS